jgi:replicative DNA helicase
MCYDATAQGAKAVAALVDPKTFDPYFRELAVAADHYLKTYNKPPGEHTYDIIEQLIATRPDEEDAWRRIFSSLKQTKDVINREYTLARASVFARRQQCKIAIQRAMPLLQKEDDAAVDEAESLLASVGRNKVSLDTVGTVLNDPKQALAFLDMMEEEAMPTGVKEIDRFNLGPVRAQFWLGVAPTNAGKTWWAVSKGKAGIIHGKRVLHVTLEMREAKVAMRYVQALHAVSKRRAEEIAIRTFKLDELGRFIGMDESWVKNRPHLDDPDIRPYLTKRLQPLARRRKLIIKQFPTGQLTLRQLEAYLDRLEATLRFIPDLIIIDYPDLMEVDSKHYRHDLDRIYKGLRGIAVERNIAMAGYSQSSKLGL